MKENAVAASITLPEDLVGHVDRLVNECTVVGARYPDAMQATVDTEDFTA